MLNFFKKLFGEKKQTLNTGSYAIIRINDVAMENGVTDKFNAVIDIYENNRRKQTVPYSEETISTLKNVSKIPVVSEGFSDDKEFEYTSLNSFGVINE